MFEVVVRSGRLSLVLELTFVGRKNETEGQKVSIATGTVTRPLTVRLTVRLTVWLTVQLTMMRPSIG
jgi:hypothetical protein